MADLTIQELDRIRERQRPQREKDLRERRQNPPKPEKQALVFIELGRYTAGDCRGLFYATQWIYEEGKEPVQKTLADGVDTFIVGNECRAALDREVGKKK